MISSRRAVVEFDTGIGGKHTVDIVAPDADSLIPLIERTAEEIVANTSNPQE